MIVISPLNAMVGQIIYARKFVNTILLLELVSFVVFTSLFLITYKTWGPSSAAMALIMSEVATLVAGVLIIKRPKDTRFLFFRNH